MNGLTFAFGRIPSFVVTLGTISFFTSAGWQLLQGRALRFDSEAFENLAIGQLVPHIPNIALFALSAWAAMTLVGFRTRFGRYMYIIGGGEAVARTAGMPERRYQIYAFALSGAMAASRARSRPRDWARPARLSARTCCLIRSLRSWWAAPRCRAASAGFILR
jgi:ribose/xylose/arabinose/galactoside ABC-type transport system permease subunit